MESKVSKQYEMHPMPITAANLAHVCTAGSVFTMGPVASVKSES